MKINLRDRYKAIPDLAGEYTESLGAFLDKIDGKEVTLVFTGTDAFEENDDNFWLPDCLWDAI